ncbi:MAG: winged helix-turn-helix domain-containing protein [Desulfobacterales bacterium]
MRFFLNPGTQSYLRELSKEFGVSTNAVREELNQLTKTHLLTSEKNGRSVMYSANTNHSLFPELRSMVQKVMGIDQVVDSIVNRLGNLEAAYLVGDYAEGKDTGIIDLVLIGDIDSFHLNDLTQKTERYISRKIRTLVFNSDEFRSFPAEQKKQTWYLIYSKDKSLTGVSNRPAGG